MPPPYRLRRPQERNGLGPLEVFRVLARKDGQPLRQVPNNWVRTLDAFVSLQHDFGPGTAATLARANVPYVDKVWAELAYESVRTEVAPEQPSRLDSVFCFADVFEAFSFPEVTTALLPKGSWKTASHGQLLIWRRLTPYTRPAAMRMAMRRCGKDYVHRRMDTGRPTLVQTIWSAQRFSSPVRF